MALNLSNLFTALGRAGRNAYLIASGESLQTVPFGELNALSYINPTWIAQLTQSYDQSLRVNSGGMPPWQQAAITILLQLCAAQNPVYGQSLPNALEFLRQSMIDQAASVAQCTIGSSSVADTANVGNGGLFITTTRGDGLILQNTIAELTALLITSDSYTGGAIRGQEPWQWTGASNVSSLGTGTGVGLWDFDWPQGSGSSANSRCIAANAYNNTAGNYLTNGDMATWSGVTPALSYWNLQTGVWGTSIQQNSTDQLSGQFCVQFNAGATLNCLEQQFNSSVVTGVGAGTPAQITAFRGYAANVWLKASGVISGGVMTIAFVNSSGTVLNDQQGNPASATITLSTITTSYTPHPVALRLPVVLPSDGIVRLRIKITTALAGANLFMDWVSFCQPTNCYRGGPSLALFSNPAAPFEASPDPDGYSITFTNNRAGATFGATWQTLINRLYQTPDLILPYSGSPTILDTLITNV